MECYCELVEDIHPCTAIVEEDGMLPHGRSKTYVLASSRKGIRKTVATLSRRRLKTCAETVGTGRWTCSAIALKRSKTNMSNYINVYSYDTSQQFNEMCVFVSR